ncbi:3'-5' exonuclease [Arcanobacterium haemolyticum]|nr:3'-5' exonuclease [Arcanobacterium haemolyticum]
MSGFAVVDCETTGLNPAHDRIIEIAVVLLTAEGNTEREWSSLINPGRGVSATFIHGITDSDVADAPTFASLLPTLTELLDGRAIVAHNAVFDVAFLNSSFARSRFPHTIPHQATVCTMELSKIYLPDGRHSLAAAAERAGIRLDNHHRALSDAWTAAHLLRHYLAAESRGERYRNHAVSRTGQITHPAAWVDALTAAEKISWPTPLF